MINGPIILFAILGFKPFEAKNIREIGYKAISLKIATKVLDEKINNSLIDKLDKILSLKLGLQREIAGNLTPQEALKWFYTKFENENWQLNNLRKTD